MKKTRSGSRVRIVVVNGISQADMIIHRLMIMEITLFFGVWGIILKDVTPFEVMDL